MDVKSVVQSTINEINLDLNSPIYEDFIVSCGKFSVGVAKNQFLSLIHI